MILLQNDNASGKITLNSHMSIEYAIHKGKRKYQEDALLVLHNGDNLLCAVADGISSLGNGDKASYITLEELSKIIHKDFTVKSFIELNCKVINILKDLGISSGCTLEGFKATPEGVISFHIGDSRTYYIQDYNTLSDSLHTDHKAGQYLINYMGYKDCEPVIEELDLYNLEKNTSILLSTDGSNRYLKENKNNFNFIDLKENMNTFSDNTSLIYLKNYSHEISNSIIV